MLHLNGHISSFFFFFLVWFSSKMKNPLSSYANGLQSPPHPPPPSPETGGCIPGDAWMGFVVVMERGGQAGSGQIWKGCCHGNHSKRPKATVDSQLITHWAKAFERDFLFIYLFPSSFSAQKSLSGCRNRLRHFVSRECTWAWTALAHLTQKIASERNDTSLQSAPWSHLEKKEAVILWF